MPPRRGRPHHQGRRLFFAIDALGCLRSLGARSAIEPVSWVQRGRSYAKPIPLHSRIVRYFRGLADFHERQRFAVGCLIGNMALEVTPSSEEVRAKLVNVYREWSAALVECLRDAQAREELPQGKDPHQLAATLIDAFEGAVMRAKVERGRESIRALRALGVAMPHSLIGASRLNVPPNERRNVQLTRVPRWSTAPACDQTRSRLNLKEKYDVD